MTIVLAFPQSRLLIKAKKHREGEPVAAAVLSAAAKAESARGLMMKVSGTSITVTRHHTDFSVTFEKRPGNPQLELMRSQVTADATLSSALKFQTMALQAAVYKARQLGWILCLRQPSV